MVSTDRSVAPASSPVSISRRSDPVGPGRLGHRFAHAADGKLIVLGEKGKLVIAEATPDGYKELASAQILEGKCWTVPVLANGRIYARNAAGDLVCVNVGG